MHTNEQNFDLWDQFFQVLCSKKCVASTELETQSKIFLIPNFPLASLFGPAKLISDMTSQHSIGPLVRLCTAKLETTYIDPNTSFKVRYLSSGFTCSMPPASCHGAVKILTEAYWVVIHHCIILGVERASTSGESVQNFLVLRWMGRLCHSNNLFCRTHSPSSLSVSIGAR